MGQMENLVGNITKWGISTVGRTSLPYCRPRQTLVNQGNPFKMKGNVTRPADVKRGKLPRKTSGNPYGALAQLVARDIRIVEVRGSTPLCSTARGSVDSQRFRSHFIRTIILAFYIFHRKSAFRAFQVNALSILQSSTFLSKSYSSHRTAQESFFLADVHTCSRE